MTKELDSLFDEVMDELSGADKYADWACKTPDASGKKMFSEMAKQELGHAHNLQNIIDGRLARISSDVDNCKPVYQYLKGKWDEYERKINFKISQIK